MDFWPGDSTAIWLELPGIFLFHRKETFDVEPTNTAERELESKTEDIPLGAYRGRSRIIVQDLTPPANFHNTFQEFPRPKALLAFLEGTHDIACLQRFSQLLNAVDAACPDLQDWERNGQIVFLPVGGSHLKSWAHRLQSLGHKEFHLYDREEPVIAEDRARIVAAINRRPGCYAALTQKRALENYLNPAIVARILGIDVSFGDQDDVPESIQPEYRE